MKYLLENPKRKRRHGRLKDNIEMDFEEMGFGCVDSIPLALDRDQRWALVDTAVKLPVTYNEMSRLYEQPSSQ
jgi:hypothetical protein